MKRSTSRILTTHTGSLPRSRSLQELLIAKRAQHNHDESVLDLAVNERVSEIVKQQANTGLDVISDGKQGKESYVHCVKDRLTGFEGEWVPCPRPILEAEDFPEYYAGVADITPQPTCTGPAEWQGQDAVKNDISNLKAAVAGIQVEEIFMTSASPGVIAGFFPNEFYPSEEAYLYSLADAMKFEYSAIVEAGFMLQLDCPTSLLIGLDSSPTLPWMSSRR